MRVTSQSAAAALDRALSAATERVSRANQQLGTGQKFSRPSDSPTGASQLLRIDSTLAAAEGYARNIGDASAWLNTTDVTLQSLNGVLSRVDELALMALNGSRDPGQRAAIAEEIRQLQPQIASMANATYLGQAVFAGHDNHAVSQDPATGQWQFTGSVGEVRRQVDTGNVMNVALDGSDLLGFSSGTDVFSALTALANAAQSGDTAAVTAARSSIAQTTERVLTALETNGIRSTTLEQTRARLEATTLTTQQARADVGEVDLAKAVLEVQSARSAYEAALAAVARTGMASLIDFL